MAYLCSMKINNNFLRQSADTVEGITQLLSRFDDKREGLTWIYLLSLADSKGEVTATIYAMAIALKIHRQTLTRIIKHLAQSGWVTMEECVNQTAVTNRVTDDVTLSDSEKASKTSCVSVEYKPCRLEGVTSGVTLDVTDKKETKQKKEEIPPAPPKEEKKQKKEKNTHTNACARRDDTSGCFPAPDYLTKPENLPTSERLSNLERRRQQFLASLTPYHERYGQEMVTHFADYWTEPNRSQTKMRFELQRTWSTPLRLATWARNDKLFTQNNNRHDKKSRPTAAEFIYNAQRTAIEETERFIRESEIRRGGIPPHLPF